MFPYPSLWILCQHWLKICHLEPINFRVFIQNKIVDILAQRINNFLFIMNTGDVSFHLKRYSITNENLLTKFSRSPNIDHNAKQLYILGEFISFYCVLDKMIYTNLLPSKYSYEFGYLHAEILYCIRKRITFNVDTII